MITPTPWLLSSMVAKTTVPLCEGNHTLQIVDAAFKDDENYYSVTLKSLDEEDEQSTIRYYIVKKDGTRNEQAIGTLNKLGYCIFGLPEDKVGIPKPEDIKNGIVRGFVKHANYEGKEYVNIYEYNPVDRKTLEIAKESGIPTLDQYAIEG